MWAKRGVTFRRQIQQHPECRADSDGTELAIHSSDLPTAQLSTCNADRTVEKKRVDQIAQAILNRDPTQIEYYSEIVKNMVGRVLTNSRGITEKQNNQSSL